jgi:hypothetical protein
LAFGLGFGHHLSLAFPGLVFLLYVVLTDPRLVVQPRRWWRPLLAGLVGLLPLIYLPIRGAMGAVQAPPGLATWQGFLHHFLARGWAGDMFAFANAGDLPHRLSLLPTLFPFQFHLLLLAAALLGLLGLLLRRDWRLFVMLAGSLALQTFVAITYRAPQTVEYLMPAYLPLAVAVGLFPALLSGYRPASCIPHPASCIPHPASRIPPPASCLSRCLPEISSALAAAVLWAGLLNGWAHAPSFAALADDHTARQAAEPLLETAPAGARILADWRWVTPLRYLRRVEGLRLDEVEVAEVYPVAEEEYRDTWLRRIQETDPGRPLLLTHFYEFPGHTTEPWEAGFLIRPRPVTEPLASLTPLAATFGERVVLLGYSFRRGEFPASRRGAAGPFHPGQAVEFVLAWQAAGPLDPPPSFTLRLMDAQGQHIAQVDRALSTDVAPGEVRFERLALALYPNLSPGRYQVMLGAYTVTGAGFETLSATGGEAAIHLTDLELVPSGCDLQSTVCNPRFAPFTLHRLAVPFAGGPTLVGVDYDRSVPDVLRIYLHWRGPAGGGEQVRVRTTDGAEVDTSLPPIPAGAYQTVLTDLRGPIGAPLHLVLADAQGVHRSAAGPWAWPVREVRLPAPSPDARFVPLGDEMIVVGAEARPAGPGDRLAVDVTLVAQRPLTVDDSTSVRLMDGEGRWLASHDYQPALGAVPTLKWIRGSRVVDRHLFSLPEDFDAGEIQATLLVYERFRLASLPSLDGRFTEVPLGTWTLP